MTEDQLGDFFLNSIDINLGAIMRNGSCLTFEMLKKNNSKKLPL